MSDHPDTMSSEGERTWLVHVCPECGDRLSDLRSRTGYCYTHGSVAIRAVTVAPVSELQAALQRAEEAEERADRIHCAAALDAEEADECSDAYREALERIAEKCESDPRNQEPEAVAKFAREVLADTKESNEPRARGAVSYVRQAAGRSSLRQGFAIEAPGVSDDLQTDSSLHDQAERGKVVLCLQGVAASVYGWERLSREEIAWARAMHAQGNNLTGLARLLGVPRYELTRALHG